MNKHSLSEEQCYTELVGKCGSLFEYLQTLITADLPPWEEHFGFLAKEVPNHWIEDDSTLAAIHRVNPIARIGILRVPPNTCYDWHKDAYRLCCVNMLISNDAESVTLFGAESGGLQTRQIIPIKYKPKTFYLFNNQVDHCVINLGPERFVFSLYFAKERPFEMVKAKLQAAQALVSNTTKKETQ